MTKVSPNGCEWSDMDLYLLHASMLYCSLGVTNANESLQRDIEVTEIIEKQSDWKIAIYGEGINVLPKYTSILYVYVTN